MVLIFASKIRTIVLVTNRNESHLVLFSDFFPLILFFFRFFHLFFVFHLNFGLFRFNGSYFDRGPYFYPKINPK